MRNGVLPGVGGAAPGRRRIRYPRLRLFALASLLLAACNAPAEREGDMAADGAAMKEQAASLPPERLQEGRRRDVAATGVLPVAFQGPSAGVSNVMLVRHGSARVEVETLEQGMERVRALAVALGGYVANVAVQSGREELQEATLDLRVPADRFDQAVNALEQLGKVENLNVGTEDVGEEFVDVTARLANARRLEQRLVDLLAKRTGRLEDVLAVERELARVREEIERYEGRLRYLRDRVALSRFAVTVHEPLPIVGPYQNANVLVGALQQAWRNFIGLIAGVIASLGVVLPIGLVAAVAWVFLRRWRGAPATQA